MQEAAAQDATMQMATTHRQAWMAVLARADVATLEAAIEARGGWPAHTVVKPAQAGTLMVEARAGGTGQRFNLGEATLTRCVVRVGERLGFSYALGRDLRKARAAAVLDALLQNTDEHEALMCQLIDPLAASQQARREHKSRRAAATKVEFFTMVRGD